MTTAQDGGKVVSLKHRPLYPQEIHLVLISQMQRYTIVFITKNALHVSGGFFSHHQGLKTVHTASGICRDFSASYRYRE